MHTVELDLGYFVEYIQLDDEQYRNLQELYHRAFQLQQARQRAQQQEAQGGSSQQGYYQGSSSSRQYQASTSAAASATSTPTTTVSSSSLHSSTSAATTVTIDGSIIEVDSETGKVRVRSSNPNILSRRGSQRSRGSPRQ